MGRPTLRSCLIELVGLEIPDVRQETEWTCGPASVKSIADALKGLKLPEKKLADLADADSKTGSSHADLLGALEKIGLRASKHDVLTSDSLRSHLRDGCPIILDVDMWGGGHWVVVHACKGDSFKVMDPSADGDVTMSSTALDGIRWSTSNDSVRGGIVVRPSLVGS